MDNIDIIKRAYRLLCACDHSWPGRDTLEGQGLLCDMRDAIAEADGLTAREVYETYSGSLQRS